jgi:hypothetical protein
VTNDCDYDGGDDLTIEADEELYSNERYEVVIILIGEDGIPYSDGRWAYPQFYGVRNKSTGVIEQACAQLPEAIFTAVGLAAALEKAPWNYGKDLAEAAVIN